MVGIQNLDFDVSLVYKFFPSILSVRKMIMIFSITTIIRIKMLEVIICNGNFHFVCVYRCPAFSSMDVCDIGKNLCHK